MEPLSKKTEEVEKALAQLKEELALITEKMEVIAHNSKNHA